MTDNEIIRALECCIKNDIAQCKICEYDKFEQGCRRKLKPDILDLINRQKAEIERLEKEKDSKIVRCIANDKDKIKSEAIKEFVERLKFEYEDERQGRYINWLMNDIINKLVKEMTGGEQK